VFVALSKTLDVLVAPLTWALGLLVAAALLRRRGRTPWALAALAFLVLLAFSFAPVDDALERAVEAGARSTFRPAVVYDAAVVLSGMVDDAAARRSGELELTQEADRVVRAFELWRTGHVRLIVLSGGSPRPLPGDVPEPDRLRDALVRWGVPPEAVVVEDRSRNTRENAIEAARVAAARNLRSLLLVTSAAHVPRALGCFRAVGLAPDVLPVDRRAGARASWVPRAKFLAQSTAALHELAGRLVYWIVGYTR
jgi:uncharacterized SAM-binding protein YcdF (DUF218 family)